MDLNSRIQVIGKNLVLQDNLCERTYLISWYVTQVVTLEDTWDHADAQWSDYTSRFPSPVLDCASLSSSLVKLDSYL